MMRAFSLAEARDWLQAAVTCSVKELEAVRFDGVCSSDLAVVPGQLFVALRGERFDGHGFVRKAMEQGAVAAVVDTADSSLDIPQLVVDNTIDALARLAAGNRDESDARLVAVTGSKIGRAS